MKLNCTEKECVIKTADAVSVICAVNAVYDRIRATQTLPLTLTEDQVIDATKTVNTIRAVSTVDDGV